MSFLVGKLCEIPGLFLWDKLSGVKLLWQKVGMLEALKESCKIPSREGIGFHSHPKYGKAAVSLLWPQQGILASIFKNTFLNFIL